MGDRPRDRRRWAGGGHPRGPARAQSARRPHAARAWASSRWRWASATWCSESREIGRARPHNHGVRISAKADYAVRATIELASEEVVTPVKGERIADAQKIPLRFLENILGELRHAGLVQSQRGAEGGYWLSREPDTITLAEIIRAVEGPLATTRGERPEDLEYRGASEPLQTVWIALRANIRDVLESVTLADIVAGELPPEIV